MARRRAAVAADVDVPALLGGDEAEVLALRFGALAHAPADARSSACAARGCPCTDSRCGWRTPSSPGRRTGTTSSRRSSSPSAAPCRRRGRSRSRPRRAPPRCPGALDARAEEVDPLAAGDLRVEAVLLRDLPRTMSWSGVISPPGTRGMTEYVPFFWMFARKRSFVSWSVRCASRGSARCRRWRGCWRRSGLQISQPLPRRRARRGAARRCGCARRRRSGRALAG